jgi:hypothetical protein
MRLLLIALLSVAAWAQANPVVRTAGTLTSTAILVGGGGQTTAASTLSATVVKMTSGVPSAASAGTDYVTPAGNVATATALAANPAACSAGDFVTDIDANGTLTCATPPGGGSGLTRAQVMAIASMRL